MQSPDFYEEMWNSLTTTGHWQGEIHNRRKNGEVYPQWLNINAITDANGDALNGAELAALIIEVPVDASGAITVERSSTNGVPFLNGTTDGLVLNAGARLLLVFPEDGGPAMSASAKDINLANAGASNTDVTITTYQRSA